MKKIFFEGTETDKAALLVQSLTPSSRVSSENALKLIDRIDAEQLAMPWKLKTQMAFVNCELKDDVPHTIATQCLIYLYDPGNGWSRDCRKRGDMLIMTAKLVEKSLRLDGISYYEKTIFQYVQDLINRRNDDPPATLNNEIVEIFTTAGYEFSYPELPQLQNSGNVA